MCVALLGYGRWINSNTPHPHPTPFESFSHVLLLSRFFLFGPTKCCRDVLKFAQIGRLNRGDDADDYDQIQIVGPEYIHPLYEVSIRNICCYFLRNHFLFVGYYHVS